MQFQVFLKNTK